MITSMAAMTILYDAGFGAIVNRDISMQYVKHVKEYATGQERRYILCSKSKRVREKWKKKMHQRIMNEISCSDN